MNVINIYFCFMHVIFFEYLTFLIPLCQEAHYTFYSNYKGFKLFISEGEIIFGSECLLLLLH